MLAVLKSLSPRLEQISALARWLFLTGVIISVVQFGTVLRSHTVLTRSELTNASVERANRLRNAIQEIGNTLSAFAAYIAASERVETNEFHTFANRLSWKTPGIVNIGWAPHLPPSLRAEFESGSARFPGTPLLWFAGPGKFEPAGEHHTYFPLSIVAAPNPLVPIGFDLFSEPRRREAIERSILSRTLVISTSIEIGNSEMGALAKRSLALFPVFRSEQDDSLMGFITGVLDLEKLMSTVVAEEIHRTQDLYLAEAQKSGGGYQLMHVLPAPHQRSPASTLPLSEIEKQANDRVHFTAAGSHWQLYSINSASPVASAIAPAARSALILFGLFSLASAGAQFGSRFWQKIRLQRLMDSQLIDRLRLFDPVTDLPNRESLLARLQENPGRPACILIVNLRRFRRVVETLDYAGGDHVLRSIARRISRVTPPGHYLARLGGDEFALLAMGDDADPEHLERLAKRIRNTIRRVIEVDDKQFRLDSVVAGAIVDQDESNRGTDVLSRAALAMRVAKSKGQNEAVVFDSDSSALMVRRQRSIENALDHAIRSQQVSVKFQPQFKTDLSLHGFEALVRWDHQGQTIRPPEIFFVAQESGRLQALDELILDEAIEMARRWRELDPKATGRVAVNMSADHFCEDDFVTRLTRRLSQAGVDGRCLEIELTEGALIEDIQRASITIKQLHEAGIDIALDDFGTGFSSLSHLRQLPVQWLKIERQFVDGLCHDEGDSAIVRATLDLARSIQAGVIAEGVEQREQFEELRRMGCDAVQGFLFSRAVSTDQALKFVGGFSFDRSED